MNNLDIRPIDSGRYTVWPGLFGKDLEHRLVLLVETDTHSHNVGQSHEGISVASVGHKDPA